MNPEQKCPRCGQPLPPDAPAGHCPKCLVHVAMEAAAMETSVPTITDISQSARLQPSPVPTVRVKYFGDYELVEEIARGGMGVVWKARQASLNRPVALKMILAGKFASEADVRRFHTEAEAAANLQHPNIVAIHEVGQHDGQHYFSMDYVAGQNLAQVIGNAPMPSAKIAPLLKTLAEAVHYAHQRGTLHRDLKPHNVLIDEHGQPHITDFGLAKRFGVPPLGGSDARIPAKAGTPSELTHSGAVMGSPSYMSPEQALGRQAEVGPASDVYSLGAMLYQMLTGKPPFSGASTLDTLRAVIEQVPIAPSKLNGKVPADLETICLKCLEKKPERRYASARALAEELERFLNREPILAQPASLLRKAWTWLVQHPWALTGAASLLVLGLTGLAYGLWEKNRALTWSIAHGQPAKMELSWPFKWTAWNFAIMMNGLFFAPLAFGDFVDRKRRNMKMDRRHLRAYGMIGAVEILVGLVFTVRIVKHYVWGAIEIGIEPKSAGLAIILIIAPFWFAALLLWHASVEARRSRYGEERPNERELFPPAQRTSTVEGHQGGNSILLLMIVFGVAEWLIGPRWGMTAFLSAWAVACFCGYRISKDAGRQLGLFVGCVTALVALGLATEAVALRARWAQPLAVIAGIACGWWVSETSRRRTGKTPSSVFEKLWPRLGRKLLDPFVLVPLVAPVLYGLIRLQTGVLVATIVVDPFALLREILAAWMCSFIPLQWVCWRAAQASERRAHGHTLILELITVTLLALSHPTRGFLGFILAWLAFGSLTVAVMFAVDRRIGRSKIGVAGEARPVARE